MIARKSQVIWLILALFQLDTDEKACFEICDTGSESAAHRSVDKLRYMFSVSCISSVHNRILQKNYRIIHFW